MSYELGVKEGDVRVQASGEEKQYTLDTTDNTATPASPQVEAYDETDNNTDVETTVFPDGNATASDETITLPVLQSLTRGHKYRIHVEYTDGGNNKFHTIFWVKCDY